MSATDEEPGPGDPAPPGSGPIKAAPASHGEMVAEPSADLEGPNPSPITFATRGSDTRRGTASYLAEGWPGLWVALAVALVPLGTDVMLRGLFQGRFIVDVTTLASAAVGLTFAALIRILSRESGLLMFGPLLFLVIMQVTAGSAFNGAFQQPPQTPTESIAESLDGLSAGHSLTESDVEMLQQAVVAIDDGRPDSSLFAWIFLVGTSIFSGVLLIRHWLPYRFSEVLSRKGRNGQ